MSKPSLLVLALVGATVSCLPALAAPPATPQEADRLKAVIERYIGSSAAGEPSKLTITPEGPSYRASFDLKQMMRPFESFGVSVDPATQTLVLTPNDDGTWHITSDAMPPLLMHMKDQTVSLKTGTYKYDGTFDPKPGSFTEQRMTQEGATLDQDTPAMTQHGRSGRGELTQKSVPAEGGTETVDYNYTVSDTTAEMTMRPPPSRPATGDMDNPAAPAVSAMQFSYTLPKSRLDLHLDRLRTPSLLDIWAFFVAHPNREAITAAQDDLRILLRGALPMLSGIREGGAAEALTVQTQVGEFKAAKFASSIDLGDFSGAGKVAMAVSMDGLVLPNLSLPAWSAGMLPTTLDLHPSMTGLHVDAAARAAVDGFDLTKDGFTPEQSQQIGKVLFPGNATVTLAPSRIAAPLFDLKFEGQASVGASPSGRISVMGTGIDKVIAALSAQAGTDPTAGQVLAQVVAVKNLGKANPDGSILWVVEGSGQGPLSVNGVPMQ